MAKGTRGKKERRGGAGMKFSLSIIRGGYLSQTRHESSYSVLEEIETEMKRFFINKEDYNLIIKIYKE